MSGKNRIPRYGVRTVFVMNPDLKTFRVTDTNDPEYKTLVTNHALEFYWNSLLSGMSSIRAKEHEYAITLRALDELYKYNILMDALCIQTLLDLDRIRDVDITGSRPLVRMTNIRAEDSDPIVLLKTSVALESRSQSNSNPYGRAWLFVTGIAVATLAAVFILNKRS